MGSRFSSNPRCRVSVLICDSTGFALRYAFGMAGADGNRILSFKGACIDAVFGVSGACPRITGEIRRGFSIVPCHLGVGR